MYQSKTSTRQHLTLMMMLQTTLSKKKIKPLLIMKFKFLMNHIVSAIFRYIVISQTTNKIRIIENFVKYNYITFFLLLIVYTYTYLEKTTYVHFI